MTKLRVYTDGDRVVFELVSSLGLLDVLETVAREKGYTREHLERQLLPYGSSWSKGLAGNSRCGRCGYLPGEAVKFWPAKFPGREAGGP